MICWIVCSVCYRQLKHLWADLISRLPLLSLPMKPTAELPGQCWVALCLPWKTPSISGMGCFASLASGRSEVAAKISFLPKEQAIRHLTVTFVGLSWLCICWLSCASGNLHPQLTLFSGKPWPKGRDVFWSSPASRWNGIAFLVGRWAQVHPCLSPWRIQPSFSQWWLHTQGLESWSLSTATAARAGSWSTLSPCLGLTSSSA